MLSSCTWKDRTKVKNPKKQKQKQKKNPDKSHPVLHKQPYIQMDVRFTKLSFLSSPAKGSQLPKITK